uniref:FIST C-terminal domain-containing protein n=1 Tax=Nocardia abscessus TaxID=120957 RepID=UPI0024583907
GGGRGALPPWGALGGGLFIGVAPPVNSPAPAGVGAHQDLRAALARVRTDLPGRPAGALLFTCNGRGRRMFGVADHDATAIEDVLDGIPLAGFFAAGEIGPIAGRNALHGFTASMALFVE